MAQLEGAAPSAHSFPVRRMMTLQGVLLGSAAEVLNDDCCEEGEGVEVGFRLGDGYDFVDGLQPKGDDSHPSRRRRSLPHVFFIDPRKSI